MRDLCCSVVLLALLASPVAAELVVEDAWLRAVPPVSKTTAGYLTLRNTGEQAVCLTGVSAAFARHGMLHSMTADDQGMRRMRHLDRVTVPAGGEVRFAPGGMHLMFSGLERVPAEGDSEELCLQFAEHPAICLPFTVKRTP